MTGEFVFDCIEKDWSHLNPIGRKAMEDAVTRATAGGNPWLTRFSAGEIDNLLKLCGFRDVRQLSMDDPRKRYFVDRTDDFVPAVGS